MPFDRLYREMFELLKINELLDRLSLAGENQIKIEFHNHNLQSNPT